MIASGKLRKYITLERMTYTQDATTNEPVEDWKVWGSVWANIDPIAGDEQFASQQVQGKATHTVTIRYIEGMTGQWRARYAGRIFQVETPLNVEERNRELKLLCIERTDQ